METPSWEVPTSCLLKTHNMFQTPVSTQHHRGSGMNSRLSVFRDARGSFSAVPAEDLSMAWVGCMHITLYRTRRHSFLNSDSTMLAKLGPHHIRNLLEDRIRRSEFLCKLLEPILHMASEAAALRSFEAVHHALGRVCIGQVVLLAEAEDLLDHLLGTEVGKQQTCKDSVPNLSRTVG